MATYSATSNNARFVLAVSLLAGCGLMLSGCGSGEVRGRISGKVTFQGKPVPEGLVCFDNDDKGIHMSGDLKSDGTYEIITAKGAGLPLGKYQACVRPPVQPLSTEAVRRSLAPKEYPDIPKKYRDATTSNLSLDVKEGTNQLDIDMKP
jgi:hypothetical protein